MQVDFCRQILSKLPCAYICLKVKNNVNCDYEIMETNILEQELFKQIAEDKDNNCFLRKLLKNKKQIEKWYVQKLEKCYKVKIFDLENDNTVLECCKVVFLIEDEQEKINQSLVLAKEKAEQENSMKNVFLANMSHEVRTPMGGMAGFLQLLEDSGLNAEQKEYVYFMKTSMDVLLTVVNDILDFSKMEAGKFTLEEVEFHLPTVVEIVLENYKIKAKEKGLSLNLLCKAGVPEVVIGDPVRLKQVINNLLSNALKFTAQGAVNFSVNLIESDDYRYNIEFTVEDTGRGISQEQMSKLFQPFMQADRSINRKYGGTGLGLVICKSIVEMMQGRLLVESKEGFGTKVIFNVLLGVSEKQDDWREQYWFFKEKKKIKDFLANHYTLKESNLDHNRFKVLVAEDDEISRLFLAKLLERLGIACDFVFNGLECVKAYEIKSYDLIFMDCKMPVIDGYEACRKIRELEVKNKQKRMPIIAVTACAMQNDLEACLLSGMDEYLSKPIEIEQIVKIIQKYLK